MYICRVFCILILTFLFSCEGGVEYVQLVNPEQADEQNENILPVYVVKAMLEARIMRSEYARNLLEKNPYLQDIDWGPVVLVENIGSEKISPVYYVFHGIMPDGAIVAIQSVCAITGKDLSGGPLLSNDTNDSSKVFLLSKEDAIKYAASKLDIPENAVVKAVFYRDRSTRSIYNDLSWKYRISDADGDTIRTGKGDVEAVYVDPYICNIEYMPIATNVLNLLFRARLTALKPIPDFRAPSGDRVWNDRQFVALE